MIKGFLPFSMVDWPGRLCAVVFVGGCNFRCPWCHNKQLAWRTWELEDADLPASLNTWIDGLVITGGEPTLLSVEALLEITSRFNLPTMLYTNGYECGGLEEMLPCLHGVSMDVKAPFDAGRYSKACGVKVDIERITRSVDVLRGWSGEVIFRTTHHPGLTDDDILRIKGYLGPDVCHVVQPYFETKVEQ